MLHPSRLLLALLCLPAAARASDWSNAGGNPARNGLSAEVGPQVAQVLWSGGKSSIIAWQPVTLGQRVFVVRQTGFPPAGEPLGSPIAAYDLDTGAELWTRNLPYNAGDWTTWVAGTSDGRLYASRAGNGGSVAAKLYALDPVSGATLWTSVDTIKAGAYDGVVFAPDGDPIVAWHQRLMRIDSDTGATVWSVPRTGSVSGNCGAAVWGLGVYTVEVVAGGQAIRRFDINTGAVQYSGPTMSGFTVQNTPMVGPDSTVYLSRTQNNPLVDYFYAFQDTGSALLQKWSVPAAWSTSSEFAVGTDGSVYMSAPGYTIAKLEASTGQILKQSAPISSSGNAPRLAVDLDGKVFVSNGGFPDGRVWCFDEQLNELWSVGVPNVNIGAPCLGEKGTLVVAGIGTNLTAYRGPSPFTNLGFGNPGSQGTPLLEGTGSLTANKTLLLELSQAAPFAPTLLVVGASTIYLPLLSATLVPAPDAFLVSAPADASGKSSFSASWPAGVPSGVSTWFQFAVVDLSFPPEFLALSNALVATAP